MINEKVIDGLKTRLESILKNYFSTHYSIEEDTNKIIGKGFNKDAIIIDYSNSQIKYEITNQFLEAFFKMNKLLTLDKNISSKYYCKPLSQTISRLIDDYLDQPLAPLTDSDLTDNSIITISSDAIESIMFDSIKLPVINSKKHIKQQKFNVIIISTPTRHYAFKIQDIVDINIKSELSRELLTYFKSTDDLEGLMEQLTSTQSGLEGLLSGANIPDVGF